MYRRYPRRRRNWVQNIGQVASTASKALSLATTVAGLINVEFKHIDLTSSLTPDTTGGLSLLTAIAQGDSVQSRDGNQVKLKSIDSRYYIKRHASATSTVARVMWIIDCDNQGTDPAVTDILETVVPHAHKNNDQRRRFQILRDDIINLGDVTVWHGRFYKKVDININFTGTASSDKTNNCIYFVYLSNEATNKPSLFVSHRCRFLDN